MIDLNEIRNDPNLVFKKLKKEILILMKNFYFIGK